ncbi:ice-binding family protein [Glaciihabitans sp. UYNi722]|uniref:ice-binding family protein n=1 Tax=Glaciihabitans sp. UYNi722 TaxID=3156344 RepID=UPI0033914119
MSISPLRSRARLVFSTGLGAGLVAVVVLASSDAASAVTPPNVGLGTADSYNVLASTTVTNTGNSVINDGDVGLDPGTSVVGFPPGQINNGVIHATDAQAEQAQVDVTTAYNDAAGRTPDVSNLIDLGGQTLAPGVYSGDALSINGDLTLNGDASSVFIFQAASTLITGSASRVLFIGGANQCNVYWKVGSSATLGSGSTFVGTILALASITANTGATITGRLLARNGAVTLDDNVISRSTECGARSAIVASSPSNATIARLAAQRQAAAAAAASAASAADARAAAASGPTLPSTGFDSTAPTIAGSLLIFAGLILVLHRRRTLKVHPLGSRHRAE